MASLRRPPTFMPSDALVPALDDLADAEPEVQRRAAVPGGVELLAGGVGHADVVGRDGVAGHGLGAVTDDMVLDDEVAAAAASPGKSISGLSCGVETHAGAPSLVARGWGWARRCGQLASRMSTTKTRVSVPLMLACGLARGAVALGGRDDEQHPAADRLADQALVPALDDLPVADRRSRRVPRVHERVEDLAVPSRARRCRPP